jgi:hypothetical protein
MLITVPNRWWIAALVLAACHSDPSAGHADRHARRALPAGGDGLCNHAGSDVPAPAAYQPPPIPDGVFKPTTSHPRIFWTPERLASAKKWVADTHYTPARDNDEVINNAFLYAVTKDANAGKVALAYLKQVMDDKLIEHDDRVRWNGELLVLVYDWCYDLIPEAQRTALVTYINTWFDHWNHEDWGGIKHPEGNYFWGYLRNGLEWALASGPENPQSAAFMEDALVTRWQNAFLPFAQTTQKGGLPSEGTQYGRYQETYPLLPFITLASGGRKIFDETDWYRGAVYYNIYNTPPASTTRDDRTTPEAFAWSDNQFWLDGGSAVTIPTGDFMTTMSLAWPDKIVGEHARRWLDIYKPKRSIHIQATDPGSQAADITKLPLDYYTPGLGYLWAHNKWRPDATTLFAMWGYVIGHGHEHLDAGTFQIWRKGRWLSREDAEYGDTIIGYENVVRPSRHSIAHNSVVFDGYGVANAYPDGVPKIGRLESRKDYAYITTDLSEVYRARTGHADRDDNPYEKTLVRELVFLRELETTVILDRMEASNDSQTREGWTGAKLTADQVPKTFVVHFETTAQPKLDGPNRAIGVNGDQALRVITLVPAKTTARVVDERVKPTDKIGQYRLEIDTKGTPQSYFLNILQARDASAPDLKASVVEDATSFTVTLVHPGGHQATLVFQKGMVSTGGTIATDRCASHPLATYVQQIAVTDNGPIWGP